MALFNLKSFLKRVELLKTSMAKPLVMRIPTTWWREEDVNRGIVPEWETVIANVPTYAHALSKITSDKEKRKTRFKDRFSLNTDESDEFMNNTHENFIGYTPQYGVYHASLGPYQGTPLAWKTFQNTAERAGFQSIEAFARHVLDAELVQREEDEAEMARLGITTKSGKEKWVAKHNKELRRNGPAFGPRQKPSMNPPKPGKPVKEGRMQLWKIADSVQKDRANKFGYFLHRYQLADPELVLKSAQGYLASKLPEFIGIFEGEEALGPADIQFELNLFGEIGNPMEARAEEPGADAAPAVPVVKPPRKKKGDPPRPPKIPGKRGRPSGTTKNKKINFANVDPNGEEIKGLLLPNGEPKYMLGDHSSVSLNIKGLHKVLEALRQNKQSPIKLELLQIANEHPEVLYNNHIDIDVIYDFIEENVIIDIAPTIGRLKAEETLDKRGIKKIVDSINSNINPTTPIATLLQQAISKRDNPRGTEVMDEIYDYAYAEVGRRHNQNVDQIKNTMLTDRGIMEEVYIQIAKRQQEIRQMANEGDVNAQEQLEAMTIIPNLKELKNMSGTVGQQGNDSLKTRASMLGAIKLKLDITEEIVKNGNEDTQVIADAINRSREGIKRKGKKAQGEWTAEDVESWINLIQNDRRKNGQQMTWQNIYEKYSQLYGIYRTSLVTGTSQGFDDRDSARESLEFLLRGSVEEVQYADSPAVNLQLDPATRVRMRATEHRKTIPFDEKPNVTSVELGEKRESTGKVVEKACLSRLLSTGAEAQRIADQEAGVDGVPYKFDEKAAKLNTQDPDEEAEDANDAEEANVPDEDGAGEAGGNDPADAVEGDNPAEENAEQEVNVDEALVQQLGFPVNILPEGAPVDGAPVDNAQEPEDAQAAQAEQPPAAQVVQPPAAQPAAPAAEQPPDENRVETEEEKEERELREYIERAERARREGLDIYNSTLNNLIKIAKDLDNVGKYAEAEEVHNTIRKYLK